MDDITRAYIVGAIIGFMGLAVFEFVVVMLAYPILKKIIITMFSNPKSKKELMDEGFRS